MALFEDIILLFSSTSILLPSTTCDNVSDNLGCFCGQAAYERKILRIPRACLYQEFVPPAIQGVEAFRVVDIIYKYTAVCPSVESYP